MNQISHKDRGVPCGRSTISGQVVKPDSGRSRAENTIQTKVAL